MQHRLDLERQIATRMNPLARAWLRVADQTLAELGVSTSTGWALVHLQRLGHDARQSELARAIGITEASLVRTLHRLESSGFVTRIADVEDRRANRLRLTPEGVALASRIDGRLIALRSEMLRDIPSDDLERVIHVFDVVSARFAEQLGRA